MKWNSANHDLFWEGAGSGYSNPGELVLMHC